MKAKRGRPVKGADLVDPLEGSLAARQRLQIILRTLTGELSIPEAGAILNIRRSRFHALRQQFLAAATGLLEPRPRGPRPHLPTAADRTIARLQREILELKLDLKAAQVREEIALVMPHLLQRPGGKKTRRSARPSVRRGGSTRSAR